MKYKQFPATVYSTMLLASIAVVASIGVEAERPGQPSIRTRDGKVMFDTGSVSNSLARPHSNNIMGSNWSLLITRYLV